MSRNAWSALAASLALAAAVGLPAAPAGAQQARCGGLFCDMYYSSRPPAQPGVPEPAPGQPGSIFLPCRDFVCGMFGGRTPDQPVAVVTEPTPVEPVAKSKRKHVAKHAAKEGRVRAVQADVPAPK